MFKTNNPRKNKYILWIIVILAFFTPLSIALRTVLTGNLSFWYDNARDLLLAWGNLSKLTLIGPTSGIPGIFYGPFWIWWLSLGILLSKDPRSAVMVVGILPYFIILPIVLIKFSRILGMKSSVIIWLLFMFSSGMVYATSMWSPYPASLFFFILVYLLVFNDASKNKIKTSVKVLLTGIVTGFIINLHISFGLGVFVGVCLWYLLEFLISIHKNLINKKIIVWNTFKRSLLFGIGTITMFIPFFVFEVRHGFQQIQAALHAFTKYGDVVTVKGLTKLQVLHLFINRPREVLKTNDVWTYIFEIIVIGVIFVAWRHHKLKLNEIERRLCLVLFTILTGILFIYLTAKNPVWEYHFIGIEVIYLLLIGLLVNKSSLLRYIVSAWILVMFTSSVVHFIKDFNTDPYKFSSLFTKEHITDIIANDAVTNEYVVYNYSPSIYQYEYSYLFRWRHNKEVPYDPGNILPDSPLIYIIIPTDSEKAKEGYVNFLAPDIDYLTDQTWEIAEGTSIIKRVKKKVFEK